MRRAAFAGGAAAALALPVVARAQTAPTPVLVGTLSKIGIDNKTVPVAGASAFLHATASADASAWIGPTLTDPTGRFAFFKVAPGSYLLRVYSDTTTLWEQVVTVPATLPPIVVHDVRVVYYPKQSDGDAVDAVLRKLHLPYSQAASSLSLATNALWYGDQVSLADVKAVASALIAAGVKLRSVKRFRVGNDWRAKVIEVGASAKDAALPPVTAADVASATTFPRDS